MYSVFLPHVLIHFHYREGSNMKTAYIVKGYLVDHSTIRLDEPLSRGSGDIRVFVEFEERARISRKRMHGMLKGEIVISRDFNEPLECFMEYML